MSRRTDDPDFASTRRLWLGAYESIGPRELAVWQREWSLALDQLPYVHNLRSVRDTHPDLLLDIRFGCHYPLNSEEIVQADLETLWTDTIAKDLRAVHSFFIHDTGLRFQFMCVTPKDEVLTGAVVVSKR